MPANTVPNPAIRKGRKTCVAIRNDVSLPASGTFESILLAMSSSSSLGSSTVLFVSPVLSLAGIRETESSSLNEFDLSLLSPRVIVVWDELSRLRAEESSTD